MVRGDEGVEVDCVRAGEGAGLRGWGHGRRDGAGGDGADEVPEAGEGGVGEVCAGAGGGGEGGGVEGCCGVACGEGEGEGGGGGVEELGEGEREEGEVEEGKGKRDLRHCGGNEGLGMVPRRTVQRVHPEGSLYLYSLRNEMFLVTSSHCWAQQHPNTHHIITPFSRTFFPGFNVLACFNLRGPASLPRISFLESLYDMHQ